MSAIRQLLKGGRAVAYYPALARRLGSIAAALFLQQIAHLEGDEDYSEDGEWVEVSQGELEYMLAMSPKVQQAARRHLIEHRVMNEQRPNTKGGNMQYQVIWSNVEKLLQSPNGNPKRKLNTIPEGSPNGNPPIEEEKRSKDSLRSSLAESPSDEGSPPEKQVEEKVVSIKYFAIKELMDRVYAGEERGWRIHHPTQSQRKQVGEFFDQGDKQGYPMEILLRALDYMVEKAADQIEGEPAAWCGYGTALNAALDGWVGKAERKELSEEEITQKQEFARETQDILKAAMEGMG